MQFVLVVLILLGMVFLAICSLFGLYNKRRSIMFLISGLLLFPISLYSFLLVWRESSDLLMGIIYFALFLVAIINVIRQVELKP